MRIAICLLTCSISFAGLVHGNSLDELASEVTALDAYQAIVEPNRPVEHSNSELSDYAYEIGLDVSKLTLGQVAEIESNFKGKPSWAFCDEHQGVEIVMNGSSLWERTKVMKLQRYADITIVH
ncbi:hypothetical protein [Vibrio ulleungensis]|uniref:Uncharacterized protein n=1 Tax=Vibrio ulleungensis TaxID=2807619 RepID=A0ABS2HH56_9VIBR|nr:hypothetical protein [Vibrio ulleungensis]MBM7036873.1 hypothetical protein [Vibrio ulleungensis]